MLADRRLTISSWRPSCRPAILPTLGGYRSAARTGATSMPVPPKKASSATYWAQSLLEPEGPLGAEAAHYLKELDGSYSLW